MDVSDVKYFFDPCGPDMGVVVVPQKIQFLALSISERTLSLKEVLTWVRSLLAGFEVRESDDCILVSRKVGVPWPGGSWGSTMQETCFRLIKFRDVDHDDSKAKRPTRYAREERELKEALCGTEGFWRGGFYDVKRESGKLALVLHSGMSIMITQEMREDLDGSPDLEMVVYFRRPNGDLVKKCVISDLDS